MPFLTAFILGGSLCVIAQIALMFTKLDPPKILIIGLFIGALLGVTGLGSVLAAWGGAGYNIMVIGAGEAIYSSMLLLYSGISLPICVVLSIFASLIILGVMGGATYVATHKKDKHA